MLKKEDYEPGLWTEEKNLTVEETRLPFTEELAGVIPQPEENREIPDGIQVVPAQNESYQNFIIRYSRNVDGAVNYESDRSFQIINELFGICDQQLFLLFRSQVLYIYGSGRPECLRHQSAS